MKKIQRIIVKGIFLRNNKVLFLNKPNKGWELPGGKVEFGNSVINTLKREISEELGIKKLNIGNIVHVDDIIFKKDSTWCHYTVIVFEVKTDQKSLDRIKISDEHSEYEWFSKSELKKLLTHDAYRRAAYKYIK